MMDDSINDTLTERNSRYGKFSKNAEISQSIKCVMRATPKWDRMRDDQREALENVAQKISRILTGDPDYADNWHDIAGYAIRVEQRLNGGDDE